MSLERLPRHRRLTRFLCQEMLYEFADDRLDERRRVDVETFLADDRDSQRELENLRKGLRYAASLSRLELTPGLSEALKAFEPRWKVRLQAWTLWSSKRGWQVLPYAVIALALSLVTLSYRSWDHPAEQTLAEQTPTPMHLPEPTPTVGPTDIFTAGAGGVPSVIDTHPGVQALQREVASAEAPTPNPVPAVGKAEIWRGSLEIPEFDQNSPAIRAKIIELGGHAAGSVELGWLRQPGEAYFHLTLPENNFARLKAYLTTLGPVRIAREPHPRRMPAGQIRIILTVKDNGKDDREPGTPAESP